MSPTDAVKIAFTVYEREAGRLWRFLDNVTQFARDDLGRTDDLPRHCQTILETGGPEAIGPDGMTRLSSCLVANGIQSGTMCHDRCISLIARASFIHIHAIFDAYVMDAVLPYWPSPKHIDFNASPIDAKILELESHLGISFCPDSVDPLFLKCFSAQCSAIIHCAGIVNEMFLDRFQGSDFHIGDEIQPDLNRCLTVLCQLDRASREIGYRLEEFLDPTTEPKIKRYAHTERQARPGMQTEESK